MLPWQGLFQFFNKTHDTYLNVAMAAWQSSKLLVLWAFNHSMRLSWVLDNQLKIVGRLVVQQWKGVPLQPQTEHKAFEILIN